MTRCPRTALWSLLASSCSSSELAAEESVARRPASEQVEVEVYRALGPELSFHPPAVWEVGQRWRTFGLRYTILDTHAEDILDYEVVAMTSEGKATIRISDPTIDESGLTNPPREIRFTRDGQRLDSETGGDILSWPGFPLVANAVHPVADGGVQQVVRRDDGLFSVFLLHGSTHGSDTMWERTEFQWEVGRPWYDSMRRTSFFGADPLEPVASEVFVETIAWDLAPGESAAR